MSQQHPNVIAVQDALDAADARDQHGNPSQVVMLPDAVPTAAAARQVIGGVSPLAHPKPVRTLLDTALAQYDVIWAAGGIPHAVFPITYAELLRVTDATPAGVA